MPSAEGERKLARHFTYSNVVLYIYGVVFRTARRKLHCKCKNPVAHVDAHSLDWNHTLILERVPLYQPAHQRLDQLGAS
jgi:hypothetical protein